MKVNYTWYFRDEVRKHSLLVGGSVVDVIRTGKKGKE